MKIKFFHVVGATLVLILTVQFIVPRESGDRDYKSNKQKGVCWVGGRNIVTAKEFESLSRNHINWISQTPFGWQVSASDPDIKLNTHGDRTWWGESDEGIIETVKLAEQQNIKTLLKPHLWIRDSWPGEVSMHTANDWKLWFANYKKFILHYAELAEAQRIEIFCIGTELSKTTIYDQEWRLLIQEIRKIYSGKLTYAANFHDEYEHIKFWDALDYIGIQAYFSLSQNNNPSAEELTASWNTHLQSIEKIHTRFQKPVLFTEIGYRSTQDAAIEPWKWPQENRNAASSEETQAACYKAFFNAAWKKEWLAGVYFWKWYPQGGHSLKEIDFTPQGKSAEKILFDYFRN